MVDPPAEYKVSTVTDQGSEKTQELIPPALYIDSKKSPRYHLGYWTKKFDPQLRKDVINLYVSKPFVDRCTRINPEWRNLVVAFLAHMALETTRTERGGYTTHREALVIEIAIAGESRLGKESRVEDIFDLMELTQTLEGAWRRLRGTPEEVLY